MILEHIEVPYDFCFDSRNIWTIVFPVESEKIISTTTRASHEVVHTQAKIIADQDVMYKYISNNLLFVATVQPKAAGPIGSATPEESGLVVYLIDTITGRILHRMNHYGAQGPVRAVCLNSSPFCSLVLPYVSYNLGCTDTPSDCRLPYRVRGRHGYESDSCQIREIVICDIVTRGSVVQLSSSILRFEKGPERIPDSDAPLNWKDERRK